MTRSIAELQSDYELSLKAEYPDLTITDGGLARRESLAYAQGIWGLEVRLDAITRGITPATAATAAELQPHADAVQVPRKGATAASKAGALEVRGTPSTPLAQGLQLTATGALALQYEILTATTIGGDGTVRADIGSIDVGSQTRLRPPQAFTFNAPPAGVNQTAKLLDAIDEGGDDEEDFGLWRERVLQVWRTRRQGGNRTDYETWALEVAFVEQAFIYGNRPARGSVSVAALQAGSGATRALSPTQRADVLAYLNARRPITDVVYVVETPTKASHGTIELVMAPGFETDWAGQAVIQSYDPVAKTIVVDAIPAGLAIGDLLTVTSIDTAARGGLGRPARVSSVLGATISLAPLQGSDPVGFTPILGDLIKPSGDKHYEVWQLVNAYLETLGPANPGRIYSLDWRSDVTVAALAGLLQDPAVEPFIVSSTIALEGGGESFAATDFDWPDLELELIVPGQWVVS